MLTSDQIRSIQSAPLGKLANRLQIAFAMANTRQSAACEATGLTPSAMSKLVNGSYQSLDIENARKLADYFGCAIEDLFPARDKFAVGA